MARLKRLLPALLIACGVCVLLALVGMKWYTAYRQKSLMQAYREKASAHADTAVTETIEERAALGILSIPKIDLTVAVCEGVSQSVLRYAVGHFPDTVFPGQMGNCAITGHRSYAWGEYFNLLDELEEGDEIVVEYGGSAYTYVVTEKYVVERDAAWVLNHAQSYELTLITCTPIRVATHRLIVKALLVQP
jgi:sortase A